MKLAGGILIGMAAGLLTLWRHHARTAQVDLLLIFFRMVIAASALWVVSLLLPEELASIAGDFLAWGLAGAVSALAVVAGVTGLECLLDS